MKNTNLFEDLRTSLRALEGTTAGLWCDLVELGERERNRRKTARFEAVGAYHLLARFLPLLPTDTAALRYY